ncbi:MAG TPA: hypothetical protein VK204_06495 [Nocardioidaceae bacterium]|nr:hypothetical protein [Nocardioidaceae bacterium]
MRTARRRNDGWTAGAAAMLLLLAACSTGADPEAGPVAMPASQSASSEPAAPTHSAHGGKAEGRRAPLRPGERVVDVAMPSPYTPSAPGQGADDYRCFLLDPKVATDSFVTGVDVAPGNEAVVHHVILFRVPPGQVAAARTVDKSAPGEGWTCFGGAGLEETGGTLEDAPWLGAWAPGSGERLLPGDIGIPLEAGSRIVMQVHYNLLAGTEPDLSSARLRIADGSRELEPLETTLLPAPVELPCRPGVKAPLCDRDAAVSDVMDRFGMRAGQMVAGLQFLCGEGRGPRPGNTQSCTRTVQEPATVRAVAGHMHLLGRSIKIELNPGRPDARTLLDIPVWNFDDQGTRPLERPVRMKPGDKLRVTCTHDQGLRDLLPAFKGQQERYVVWGEGTTDEMCLGIVMVTRS